MVKIASASDRSIAICSYMDLPGKLLSIDGFKKASLPTVNSKNMAGAAKYGTTVTTNLAGIGTVKCMAITNLATSLARSTKKASNGRNQYRNGKSTTTHLTKSDTSSSSSASTAATKLNSTKA